MSKRISMLMVLAALTISAQAKVRLPHIIGDNMILQQQTDARLWGWAQPGKTVKVSTSSKGYPVVQLMVTSPAAVWNVALLGP